MDVKEVYEARERLRGHIKETPVVYAPNLGEDIYLKVEVLQDTGSFKLRGAYNKIATLSDEEAERGVVACSAGNHAQGVAKSASERGIKSVICMPYHAPLSKVRQQEIMELKWNLLKIPLTMQQPLQKNYLKKKATLLLRPLMMKKL